jgi:cysteine-rich repeat protein
MGTVTSAGGLSTDPDVAFITMYGSRTNLTTLLGPDRCCLADSDLTGNCGYHFKPANNSWDMGSQMTVASNTSNIVTIGHIFPGNMSFSGLLWGWRHPGMTSAQVENGAANPETSATGWEPTGYHAIEVYDGATWTAVTSWYGNTSANACAAVDTSNATIGQSICTRFFAPTTGTGVRLSFDNSMLSSPNATGGYDTTWDNGGWMSTLEIYANAPADFTATTAPSLALVGTTLAGATQVATATNFTINFKLGTRTLVGTTVSGSAPGDQVTSSVMIEVVNSAGAAVPFVWGDHTSVAAPAPSYTATWSTLFALSSWNVTVPSPAAAVYALRVTANKLATYMSPSTNFTVLNQVPTSLAIVEAPVYVSTFTASTGADTPVYTVVVKDQFGATVTHNKAQVLGADVGAAVLYCTSYTPAPIFATAPATPNAACSGASWTVALDASHMASFSLTSFSGASPQLPGSIAVAPGTYKFQARANVVEARAYSPATAVDATTVSFAAISSVACTPPTALVYATPIASNMSCVFREAVNNNAVPYGPTAPTGLVLGPTLGGVAALTGSITVTPTADWGVTAPLFLAHTFNEATVTTGTQTWSVAPSGSAPVNPAALTVVGTQPLPVSGLPSYMTSIACTVPAIANYPATGATGVLNVQCKFLDQNGAFCAATGASFYINMFVNGASVYNSSLISAGQTEVNATLASMTFTQPSQFNPVTMAVDISVTNTAALPPTTASIVFSDLAANQFVNPPASTPAMEYSTSPYSVSIALKGFTTTPITLVAIANLTQITFGPGVPNVTFTFTNTSQPLFTKWTLNFNPVNRPAVNGSANDYTTAITFAIVGTSSFTAPTPAVIAVTQPPAPKCANNMLDVFETCDDNNTLAGDGCGPTCAQEPGWVCTGALGSPTTCAQVPVITEISTRELMSGIVVTIFGSGFGASTAAQTVKIGGVDCTPVVYGNANNVSCTITPALLTAFPPGTPSSALKVILAGTGLPLMPAAVDLGLGTYSVAPCAPACNPGEWCRLPAGGATTGGVCAAAGCGNGVVDAVPLNAVFGRETCDDNNTRAGDGCSLSCKVETGYACAGVPSNCTLIPVAPSATPVPIPPITTASSLPTLVPVTARPVAPTNATVVSVTATGLPGSPVFVTVSVAAGTIATADTISVTSVPRTSPTIPVATWWPLPNIDFGVQSVIADIKFGTTTTFAKPVALTFAVTTPCFGNLTAFTLAYIDRAATPPAWVEVPGTLTAAGTNLVSASTTHFTEYAIIAKRPAVAAGPTIAPVVSATPSGAPAPSAPAAASGPPPAPPPPKKPLLKQPWFIPTIAGGGGGLVLIIVVIVVLCCCKKKEGAAAGGAAAGAGAAVAAKGSKKGPNPNKKGGAVIPNMPEEPQPVQLEEVVVNTPPPPPPAPVEADWIADITSFFTGLFGGSAPQDPAAAPADGAAAAPPAPQAAAPVGMPGGAAAPPAPPPLVAAA